MRLAGALAVSLGAHFAAVAWVGGFAGEPGNAASGSSAPPPSLRAALVRAQTAEAAPAASPVQPARPRQRLPVPKQYLPAAELDARPQIRTHVMPAYPSDVFSGTRGRVVLRLFIGANGSVDEVRVSGGTARPEFERSAVEAFSRARFTPGVKRGAAVPSELLIEVTFGD